MKTTRQLTLIAILSSLLVVVQVSLSFIPNVELVSFFMIIYGLFLPLSTSCIITLLFVALEMLIWGMGDWVIGYMWIWLIWVLLIHAMRPILKKNVYGWALLSGLWGFAFGLLFAINHGIFYGFNYSLAYYLKGLMFDIVHALGNYLVVLLLFTPTRQLFSTLLAKGKFNYEH